MRKSMTRLPFVVWGATLWALLPLLPHTWALIALHRYFSAAYAWRRRWIPTRARLVAQWAADRER